MSVTRLIDLLKGNGRVFIQTHNFPDHDAISAAFGLFGILRHFGVAAPIIYYGEIQRQSLRRMIEILEIPALPHFEVNVQESDRLIIVDGCKGNRNVSDLGGKEVAVIDHHMVAFPEKVPFLDIRPNLGSCSTLILSYFREAKIPMEKAFATALMIGIGVDTAHLLRGASFEDVEAYAELAHDADLLLVNSILRNNTQIKDLEFYRYSIEHARIHDGFAFCFFPQGCDQNLLGILGDFFLGIDDVDFTLICARNGTRIDLSVRCEGKDINCTDIIQDVLAGIGDSGGHREMAGGFVPVQNLPKGAISPDSFLEQRFFTRVQEMRAQGAGVPPS